MTLRLADDDYREKLREILCGDPDIEVDSDAFVSRAHHHLPEVTCRNADEDGGIRPGMGVGSRR